MKRKINQTNTKKKKDKKVIPRVYLFDLGPNQTGAKARNQRFLA
jgi:hypothetical protein